LIRAPEPAGPLTATASAAKSAPIASAIGSRARDASSATSIGMASIDPPITQPIRMPYAKLAADGTSTAPRETSTVA
jgi:hypothetical protein